ncbi:tRNA (adenosine(37)-N6)-threonylcarbamoyltransferase complex dimerization subunit type 1 TsaB [Corynebacterium aquatimens]|uniref:tRNA (adenosine(37)-N6)-threonylcarbamoyltransferase complex dimerization subunit type 1 TsaB n=1 Tax=Corynebacterium TaxID=1716 RepID=UPI001F29C8FB|nr:MULTISPECIES: tRNA (adenosine(37)-N6)-threonylcarbamoyltransferase complex dimerization subunit type 1 TsaB [Corynebacterium]QYH20217.1 tRNA (adenosine(37)-N6)-threonylcarbamoyltransferase complex dimerization subunit type 1 TsaB [Corynebacterium aquatimens]UIZ92519.1 tRNA (adenosine(37)-N6)-threonylcarbamoyltransferase complex dimerization subunit type 1 TsaB [Corynebacterium sp. CNCTC7651]
MLVLALDTATTDLIVGIAEVPQLADGVPAQEPTVLAESVEATRAHNERLVPTTQAVLGQAGLRFADLDAIVVGCGPGPFTGLRVGMASASAFGQALGVPVYGVVTHDAVAAQLNAPTSLIVTDARRREVYWAFYRGTERTAERVAGPSVCAPGDIAIGTDAVDVLSVPEQLAGQIRIPAQRTTYVAPRTEGLIRAADFTVEPAPLLPHYLRRPDAVEPKAKPKSPAIPDVAL